MIHSISFKSKRAVGSIVFFLILGSVVGAYFARINDSQSTCNQSAQSNVYLTILDESTLNKLQGATVAGEVTWLCGSNSPKGYFVASQNIAIIHTPANGTAYLGSIIGNYSLTLTYSGISYQVRFGVGAEQNVNVTVSLPSDRISIVGCTFFGGSCFNETPG